MPNGVLQLQGFLLPRSCLIRNNMGSRMATVQNRSGRSLIVGRVGEGHERAGIQDVAGISHAQNLPAGKGRLGPL